MVDSQLDEVSQEDLILRPQRLLSVWELKGNARVNMEDMYDTVG